MSTYPSSAAIVAEPLGVTLVISAWNFPFCEFNNLSLPTQPEIVTKAWGTSNSLWSLENDSLNNRLFRPFFGCTFTHKPHFFFQILITHRLLRERESWAFLEQYYAYFQAQSLLSTSSCLEAIPCSYKSMYPSIPGRVGGTVLQGDLCLTIFPNFVLSHISLSPQSKILQPQSSTFQGFTLVMLR